MPTNLPANTWQVIMSFLGSQGGREAALLSATCVSANTAYKEHLVELEREQQRRAQKRSAERVCPSAPNKRPRPF